jgi:hypothetical protein
MQLVETSVGALGLTVFVLSRSCAGVGYAYWLCGYDCVLRNLTCQGGGYGDLE